MTPDPFRASAGDREKVLPDPLKVLTDNQKDALRLAHEGLSAGEIAVRLNLRTKAAANDRIWEARQKLGGVSKREAGRMLAEAEQRAETLKIRQIGDDPYFVLPHPEPLWIAPKSVPDQHRPAVDVGGELKEERAAFQWDSPTELPAAPRIDRHPLLMVLVTTLVGFAILSLVKPVVDGFSWVFEAVAPTFARQGWTNGQVRGAEGCWRGNDQRNKEQSTRGSVNGEDNRCDLRSQGRGRRSAVGR